MNTTLARPVLSLSFAATSLAGGAFLIAFWLPTDAVTAFLRASLFVVSMAAVHLAGYQLYVKQDSSEIPLWNVDLSQIQPHLSSVVATQLPSLLLASLLLDGGRGLRICLAAIVAHWLAIAFVFVRRRHSLTLIDTLIIRWGFFLCLACAVLLGSSS